MQGSKLTLIQEQEIIKLYADFVPTTEIQRQCHCGAGAIYSVLDRNRIPIREKGKTEMGKCKNREFFKEIDTEAKAYFLGLLLADGCASGTNRITLSLQESDREIIETFAILLGISKEEVRRFYCPSQKNSTSSPSAVLSFSSRRMREHLEEHGFVPNKVHKVFLPKIQETLMSHMIRGFFDGDGHVSRYSVYISGTKELCHSLSDYFAEKQIPTYLKEQLNTGVWYIKAKGKQGRQKMLEFMYLNATIFLKRKLEEANWTHFPTAPLCQ